MYYYSAKVKRIRLTASSRSTPRSASSALSTREGYDPSISHKICEGVLGRALGSDFGGGGGCASELLQKCHTRLTERFGQCWRMAGLRPAQGK